MRGHLITRMQWLRTYLRAISEANGERTQDDDGAKDVQNYYEPLMA